ncbi:hypothetical protein TRICI_005039 [Trichomonascus ciferrii]|uniref:CSC1/OSCA1-like 7TM region domain-containing protein n=1 Tax=Trichomonascus ciferrii TaxID=44093 RepID=A0A642V327_9ASCO|nr:hypothetical protein TRICI_005039 [Trichomonascus ciferrii]
MIHKSFESTRYDAKSVLAGLILSLGGTVLLFGIFCVLRPRHNLLYAPKIRYSDEEKRPQPLGRGPFQWIRSVFWITEDTLIQKLGIDAAIFIRFIIMIRNMFLATALIGCAIGIPINVYYNLNSKDAGKITAADSFRLMTPSSLTGMPLAAHIVMAWVIDGIVLTFLYFNFKKVVEIRRSAFMSREYQNALFMRTLLVTEIPRKYLSESGVTNLMSRFKVSRPINQINIGRNVKELSRLLELHEKTVVSLEKILAKHLRNPEKLPPKRPLCKPLREDRKMYPKKVDAIEYYIQRSQRLEKQILTARESIDAKNCLPYGLVSYYTQEDCHTVAKGIGDGRHDKLLTQLAPRAEDIIWPNIVLSRFERRNKQWWGNLLFAVLLVAWIVPNAFIGCFLTQLSRIGTLSSGFQRFMNQHQLLFSVLQGFLAPLITTLVFLILPVIMRRMSQWQGRITKSRRERDVTLKLYTFFFFNNFLVLTVTNVVWNITTMIIELRSNNKSIGVMEAVEKFSQNFSSSIITASSFWVMYMLRANIGLMMDLLQVVTLLYNSIQRYLLSPTPRELMLATAPQPFQYASYYNWLLFYSTIALAFTSIQPLILPIIAFYLCIDTVVKKYMLMYMFVTKFESDGMYWPLVNNCLTFATAFGNLIVLAIVWVQGGWRMAIAVAPLPFIVLAYKIFTAVKFNDKFYYFIPTPSEREFIDFQASMQSSGWEDRSNLEQRYLNPAINKRLTVPMVHARAEHLLKSVCTVDSMGNLDGFEYEANPFLPGNKDLRKTKETNRRSVIGDNKFDLVHDDELDYDHYRQLADTDSIAPPVGQELHQMVTPKHSQENLSLQPPPTIYASRSRAGSSSSLTSSDSFDAPDYNPYNTSRVQSQGVFPTSSRTNLAYDENHHLNDSSTNLT